MINKTDFLLAWNVFAEYVGTLKMLLMILCLPWDKFSVYMWMHEKSNYLNLLEI